ncbi:cid13-like poly(A) RNA polymerase [Coniochaeta sp. 2T2.1]|nr:cid13-like poly(A) RNA polymerase [Coniochaeta sp. 2T2.1]
MENYLSRPGGLEDRLRELMLANSEDLPPSGVTQGNVQLEPPNSPANGTHKAAKKRPNQAQRRQMANEMTIPIDAHHQPVFPQGGMSSNAGYGHGGTRQSQNFDAPALRGGRQGQGHHQSVDFQYSPRSPTTQNHSLGYQQHRQSSSQGGPHASDAAQNWRQSPYQNQSRGPRGAGQRGQGRLNNPRLYQPSADDVQAQAAFLEKLALGVLSNAEISVDELMEKENFRLRLEQICRAVVVEHEFSVARVIIPPQRVELKCFGSLASGFATKAADMDLALLSPCSAIQPDAPGSPIPRLLEKAFLDFGIGARLLTRTRVPIIKVCERPPRSLRDDLCAARLKWEAGECEDIDGPDEEQAEEPSSAPTDEEQQHAPAGPHGMSQTLQQQMQQPSQFPDPVLTAELGDSRKKLASLKQQPNMSFDAYCNKAKKFLRQEGLADLSYNNAATYPEGHRLKLGYVCRAFIEGLADEELKKRLLSYRSVKALPRHPRTLAGVIVQIEGEMLAMLWKQRPVEEKDEHQEGLACETIDAWLSLQNDMLFEEDPRSDHHDPTQYQKRLQNGLVRLKSIPSLMICQFTQTEFESAAAYHRRAIQLLLELGGTDDPLRSPKALPVIVHRYITGIHDPETRAAVDTFVGATDVRTLRVIARRHKSLQLAHDFQRALDKGYYQEPDAELIRRYVTYLQGPMTPPKDHSRHYDYTIPKTRFVEEILPGVLRLSNPSYLAPNQPRDRYKDPLEFPKTGAGVQCDVNFSAHLAIHNTALLRCYSYTDPRVTPMILFVKHWAKVRGINNPYRGTLSSYGYVLMVIHYLVNVVQPFVCPNLQILAPRDNPDMPPDMLVCKGYNVRFWRDEETIRRLAADNMLTQNRDSLGQLLRGFFEYYAFNGNMSSIPNGPRGFDWGRDALSLRTPGGTLAKQQKGWIGAKTVKEVKTVAAPPTASSSSPTNSAAGMVQELPTTQEVREIRHRYLFAIEDPFELDHNVARTVTHNGIVAIRDEFRRAWRLIRCVTSGSGDVSEDLLEDASMVEEEQKKQEFEQLLLEIHGDEVVDEE